MDAADASPIAARERPIAAWLGPALILGSVLFALRGFLVGGSLTNQHPDLLTFWLPRWTFLGDAIAGGTIPLWNPLEMTGYRFAADPQSGWLYAPPMVLFSTLSPGLALRAFIVLNPLLAGLGIYAFLRRETLGRAAATLGGLVLAMTMATSTLAISLPFAGALAWTTVVLVGASGYRRAHGWASRLAWLALGAFAWTQVAAAHMSHGLVIATAFVVAYLVTGAVTDVRARSARTSGAAARVALFVVALPLAALPILVPHVDFLGESSLRDGYGVLGDRGQTVVGDPVESQGVWAAWPLGFAAAPGAYAGAGALACALLAARARRLRPLVVAVGGVALVAYVLTSPLLVDASWFRRLVLAIPFGDVHLHSPGRLRYVVVLALPILAAAGLQGLIERPLSSRAAAGWLAGTAFVFVGWPLVAGGNPARFALVAVVLLVGAPILYAVATRRWAWATAWALVGVLAIELFVSAVYAQVYEGGTIFTGLETGDQPVLAPQVLRYPELDEDAYLAVTPIVEHLRTEPGRYATWAPPSSFFEKGYLWMKSPDDWPALAPNRGSLFGVADALGYNPVQLPRYRRYMSATNDLSLFYNASVLNAPSLEDVRLLGLRYLVVPTGLTPPVSGRIVARAGLYSLWELDDRQPLATVSDRAEGVRDLDAALEAVTTDGFDPAERAVIERLDDSTCVGDCRPPAAATVTAVSDAELRIALPPDAAGILTVRNAYDPGWRAAIDGAPARTAPVDAFLQGVALRGERPREVVLTYHDDAVITGLWLGGVVWALLLAAPLVVLAVERRRPAPATRPRPAPPGA